MTLQRHDLLAVEPGAWAAMLLDHPGLETLPCVADWATRGWPVIVRRRAVGDAAGGVAAALPLPPIEGKRRVGFSFASDAGLSPRPPVFLDEATTAGPKHWLSTLRRLWDLGEAEGVPPRVFGSLLWEHLTGLPYVTTGSDLDLLWPVSDARTAASLVTGLARLDAASAVRIDGELILPDGGGVNWREVERAMLDGDGEVLVKTIDGIELRKLPDLFDLPATAA